MEISARFLAFTAYGVQWVLWLLIGLSVISIGMMLERLWHFATYHPNPQALAKEIRRLMQTGAALRTSGEHAPSIESLDAAFEGTKVGERLRLERNLAFLGTLGSNAPFVGLFGTVLGIIKAFHDLAGNQAGGPAVVMAGISEALVATAVGLMVAIPAVVAFNYFNRRVRTIMTQVDWMAHLALAEIKASILPSESSTAGAVTLTPVISSEPLEKASFLPAWGRRAIPVGAMAVLLVIGGVLFKRSTQHSPQALVAAAPASPAVIEPRTQLIAHGNEVNHEEPGTPPEAAKLPTAMPAVAKAAPVAPPITPPVAPAPVDSAPAASTPVASTPAAPAPVTPKTAAPMSPAAAANAAKPALPNRPGAAPPGKWTPKWFKGKKRRPQGAAPPATPPAEGGSASPSAAKSEDAPAASPAPAKAADSPGTTSTPAVP